MRNFENILNKELLQQYFSKQPVNKAYLFGSFVRGEERKDSDIDILVEFDKNTDLFQLISIKLQLEAMLKRTVDIISVNGLSSRFKKSIDKEKVLIYEK